MEPSKQHIEISPGLRWLDVYRVLDEIGVSVLGSRTPDVGVGALILGGSLPSFPSECGSVYDREKNFKLILSSSCLGYANVSTGHSSFWTLKGEDSTSYISSCQIMLPFINYSVVEPLYNIKSSLFLPSSSCNYFTRARNRDIYNYR